MKLVRFGEMGKERPGLLDASGKIRDLSSIIADITGATLDPKTLAKLRALNPDTLPAVDGKVRIGPCVGSVPNFYGIGRNYADLAAESKREMPKEAVIFNKATSCISGPNDDVIIPHGAEKVDAEVEIAVVIGTAALNVSEDEALNYVAGYCVCNELSERAWQMEGTGNGVKGKSAPTFGPIGPWLVTSDEIPDPQTLDLYLDVNGERRQTGNSRSMVFNVKHLVSFSSKFMRLLPGDIIATGTPAGVGMSMNPPRYLKAGDVIRLGVEKLGEQQQTFVPYRP